MRLKSGFSLIEILAAIIIIGTMVSMVLPRLKNRATEPSIANFVTALNRTIQWTRQQAILDRTTYRITFFAPKNAAHKIVVETETENPEKKDQTIWSPLQNPSFTTETILPPELTIVAAYLNNKEQLAVQKQMAHCYIMHEGLVQNIILHILFTQRQNDISEKATIIIEPFLGTCTRKDGHLTPKQLEKVDA